MGPIFPRRDLLQGDPLSPYLFILCTEGLSDLICKAERRGDIHGISICNNAPIISHLLFAYDCFLFFMADEREANTMKHILELYEAASGQAISLPKSEVYYNCNVPIPIQESITFTLGVRVVMGIRKYIGLPSMIGRSIEATFGFIKDHI